MNNTSCNDVLCQFTAVDVALIRSSTIIITIIGIVGNIATVIAVLSSEKLRSVSNLSTLNLACSDLLLSIFVVPLWTIYMFFTEIWVFGEVFCKIYGFVLHGAIYATLLNLFVVSIERFVAVCFPFFLRMRKKVFIYCIPLVWIAAIAISAPNLVYRVQIEYPNGNKYCMEEFPEEGNVAYKKDVFESVFFFGLMFTMISMQIATMCRLRIKGAALKENSHINYVRRRNASCMLFILMLTCLVCWTPSQTALMIWRFELAGEQVDFDIIFLSVNIPYFSIIAIHPIIFFFLSPRGKRTLSSIIQSVKSKSIQLPSSKTSSLNKKGSSLSRPFSGQSTRGSSQTKDTSF